MTCQTERVAAVVGAAIGTACVVIPVAHLLVVVLKWEPGTLAAFFVGYVIYESSAEAWRMHKLRHNHPELNL
jgi:hypothetical protein